MPFVLIEGKKGKKTNDKNNQKGCESYANSTRQSRTRIERCADADGSQTQQ